MLVSASRGAPLLYDQYHSFVVCAFGLLRWARCRRAQRASRVAVKDLPSVCRKQAIVL